MTKGFWFAGCFLLAAACSGDGASKTPQDKTAAASTPAGKCSALSAILCAREHACLKTPVTSPCESDLDAAGLCAKIESVEMGITDCSGDINTLSCGSLFPNKELSLPNSCMGVFVFAKSVPEKQCEALLSATCQRLVECVGNPTTAAEGTALVKECFDSISASLDCQSVTAVSSTYPTCLEKTKTLTCSVLFPGGELADLPECTGVLGPDGAGMGTGGMGGSTPPPKN
jgi:hypothetical protein